MPFLVSPKGKRFLDLPSNAARFIGRVPEYETEAAQEATEASRATFTRWLGNRPLAAPRAGRATTEGQFANYLKWQRDAYGTINFDILTLEEHAPEYWAVQEIGSGQTARILSQGGSGIDIPSQIGRKLPSFLYWGDAEGAVPFRPMTMSKRRDEIARHAPMQFDQQLYPVDSLPDELRYRAMGRKGKIRREDKGKHFIRDGGEAGWEILHDQLLADANRTFR